MSEPIMKELITDYLLSNGYNPERVKKEITIQRETFDFDHPFYKIRIGEDSNNEWIHVEIHEILNWMYLKIKNK